VYSLFRGTMGASTSIWRRQAGWWLLESVADVREKLKLVSRDKNFVSRAKQSETLDAVVNHIVAILEQKGSTGPEARRQNDPTFGRSGL